MIRDLHNSNKPSIQLTLAGDKLIEEGFFLLGFAKGEDLQIERSVWFMPLSTEQIDLLNKFLKEQL